MSNVLSKDWRDYQNGNTHVYLDLKDGTKIRVYEDDNETFVKFPENIDMTISTYCAHNCAFCYAGCSKDGTHADFGKYDKLLSSLRPYTELAININSEVHPYIDAFLEKMRKQNVVVNATLRQDDFENDALRDRIEEWCRRGYLHGVGISLCEPTKRFIELAKQNPNYVIHTIAGITPMSGYDILANNGLKILILGYKTTHRGDAYYEKNEETICGRIYDLAKSLLSMTDKFSVISFDNAAIEQLGIETLLNPEEYEQFYMGDDGEFTMAINLADGTFASSSISDKIYHLTDKSTVDDIFAVVQKEIKDGKDAL